MKENYVSKLTVDDYKLFFETNIADVKPGVVSGLDQDSMVVTTEDYFKQREIYYVTNTTCETYGKNGLENCNERWLGFMTARFGDRYEDKVVMHVKNVDFNKVVQFEKYYGSKLSNLEK